MAAREFRVAGRVIRVTDDALCHLMEGFEAVSDGTRPLMELGRCEETVAHGVRSVTPAFRAAHILRCTGRGEALLTADDGFERVALHLPAENGETEDAPVSAAERMLLAAVYTRLARTGVLLAHGALVEVPGRDGLLFIGPSGVGKSTQAELWHRHRGARILNGDRVFLTVDDEEVCGHGSPFAGSSCYRVNASAPLRGVICLSQAGENSIRQAWAWEAVATFMAHLILPLWDTAAMSASMDTAATLMVRLASGAPRLPVFFLACRPDEAAVALTEREVFQ